MATDRLAQADEQLRQRATADAEEAERKLQRGIAADKRFRLLSDAWDKIGEAWKPGATFLWEPWISSICKFCTTAKVIYADEPIDWISNIRRVLKSIQAPASDPDALRLIRAGFMGGEPAVESKLIEFKESGRTGWASTWRSIGSDNVLHHVLRPETLEQWRAEDLARKAALEDAERPEAVTPATDEKQINNESGDTARGTPRKKLRKIHPWDGTAQECFNDFQKEKSNGNPDELKPFVLGWAIGKKKNGKPIGPQGLYKRFTDNPNRWQPFLLSGHSGDT